MSGVAEIVADAIIRAMIDGAKNAPAHAIPKSRALFIFQIGVELGRYGYKTWGDARETALDLMMLLEEADTPWGDPSGDWSVGAAREWVDEMMEDR